MAATDTSEPDLESRVVRILTENDQASSSETTVQEPTAFYSTGRIQGDPTDYNRR